MVNNYIFQDIVIGNEGLLKGPFGSDLKRSLYVPKSKDTYKVYLQENILRSTLDVGDHYISKEYYETKMFRYAVKENDFIVTCDGTLGEIYQLKGIKEPGLISSSLLRITLNPDLVDYDYFYYLFKALIRKELITQANNSVLKHLPGIEVIRNHPISLPNLNVQKRVGSALKQIDNKIRNNDKIISELESMAKTLYDYWFLQFEFPNEEGKPYKSSGGKMVYNEELKREIPEGWILKHAVDIAEIKTGKEDANHSTENGQYPFFTCSNETLKCDDYKFDSNSILIAGNGDFNVKHYKGKFNAYQRTYVITPLNEKYIGLFELCCKQTIERFKKGSNGSIVKFITLGDIQNIQMLDSGHDDLLKPFNDVLVKIDVIKKENQELASLRDFLLPMLMNGQVNFK